MPARSRVEVMPEDDKAWLDQALVKGNFSGYEALAEALEKRGFSISKSALHRYGSKFEERIAQLRMATEQAKAVVQATPDDAGDMTEALMRLVQQKVFNVLVECEIDPTKADLGKLTLQVARLARSSVPLRKYAAEVKAKLGRVIDSATAAAESGAETDPLALLKRVREEAYGIVDDA